MYLSVSIFFRIDGFEAAEIERKSAINDLHRKSQLKKKSSLF